MMPNWGCGFSPSNRRRFDGCSELYGSEKAELEEGPPHFFRPFRDLQGVLTIAVDLLFGAARASRRLLRTDNHMHLLKSQMSALFEIISYHKFTLEIVAAIILDGKEAREQSRC